MTFNVGDRVKAKSSEGIQREFWGVEGTVVSANARCIIRYDKPVITIGGIHNYEGSWSHGSLIKLEKEKVYKIV